MNKRAFKDLILTKMLTQGLCIIKLFSFLMVAERHRSWSDSTILVRSQVTWVLEAAALRLQGSVVDDWVVFLDTVAVVGFQELGSAHLRRLLTRHVVHLGSWLELGLRMRSLKPTHTSSQHMLVDWSRLLLTVKPVSQFQLLENRTFDLCMFLTTICGNIVRSFIHKSRRVFENAWLIVKLHLVGHRRVEAIGQRRVTPGLLSVVGVSRLDEVSNIWSC